MKKYMNLVLTLLCSMVFCSENRMVDKRIEKMYRYRVLGCCSVPWKNGNYSQVDIN